MCSQALRPGGEGVADRSTRAEPRGFHPLKLASIDATVGLSNLTDPLGGSALSLNQISIYLCIWAVFSTLQGSIALAVQAFPKWG
ncbi:hypothetical protein VUR80DRAFT_3210 [Thermomyces stellatus]